MYVFSYQRPRRAPPLGQEKDGRIATKSNGSNGAMASRRSGFVAAGNMDATEYKHIVLGSIFIKYVSAERF
jgi:hypothetical protein